MPDISIVCPRCNMQITFGIGVGSIEEKDNDLLGFVFTCPSCHAPVSYQANEGTAVEMDKESFDNFKKAVAKKFNNNEPEGTAFKGPKRTAKTISQKPMDEDMYENMLRDIRESDSFDDFMKRIE